MGNLGARRVSCESAHTDRPTAVPPDGMPRFRDENDAGAQDREFSIVAADLGTRAEFALVWWQIEHREEERLLRSPQTSQRHFPSGVVEGGAESGEGPPRIF